MDTAVAEAVDQRQQAVEGVEEGFQGGQLRADVAVDTDHFQVRQLGGANVHLFGIGDGDTELVFFQTRGDVRVGAGIDVRVDPQRNRRAQAHLGGNHLQAFQLVGGLDVEAVHADFQGATHVFTGLADTGENHAIGAATGGQDTLQLTAGNDVETCAQTGQQVQHAEVGVGFDGKAHQVRNTLQSVGIATVLGLDVGARVDIGWRAETFGDGRQGHAFREQFTVAVVESVHGLPLLVLVRLRLLTVFAVFWQVQRALLATGGNEAGNRDERREGGDQALHGVIL
ncbi:hypothetical protein D3C77_212140 [compost metagenome]